MSEINLNKEDSVVEVTPAHKPLTFLERMSKKLDDMFPVPTKPNHHLILSDQDFPDGLTKLEDVLDKSKLGTWVGTIQNCVSAQYIGRFGTQIIATRVPQEDGLGKLMFVGEMG